jgi:hypothetical protein
MGAMDNGGGQRWQMAIFRGERRCKTMKRRPSI